MNALHTSTFAVGRYRCTLTFPEFPEPGARAIDVAWSPSPGPTWESLSEGERAQYLAGRDAAVAVVARKLEQHIAVIGGDGVTTHDGRSNQ